MAKRSKPQTIEYAFRYAQGTNTERARMAEMIRVNLHELVQRIALTYEGETIKIDGFRLLDDPETTYVLTQPVSQEINQRQPQKGARDG